MTAVVLDTDIGTDIDDTWALAMLLRCPELDLKLVTTVTGDTTYRARLAAGILAAGGRDDVPVGIGVATQLAEGVPPEPQGRFAAGVDLGSYRGGVHPAGVEALVERVMSSEEAVAVIAIGPMTNVGAALELEPRIAERARLVGMLGWVRGVEPGERPLSGGPSPEYNVVMDVEACRAAFAAGWGTTITPIDTCGTVVLRDERYRRVREAAEGGDPLLQALLRNYEEWADAWPYPPEAAAAYGDQPGSPFWQQRSSVLFDTVAVYLGYEESFLNIEPLPISIDDDGLTRIDPAGRELRVATSWRDRDGFEDHLVERLTACEPAQIATS
jgi:inosine-uridine nucleoside N-ribohydrolase